MWMCPNIGVPQNGWFIMENLIKMDDLGGPPLFLETPMCSTCPYTPRLKKHVKNLRFQDITLPPIIMVQWKMGSWKMCGLSPNGLFSTSMIMGGRVTCFFFNLSVTSIFIGKMLVPLGWNPSCLTPPRSPLKGDIPNKYPLYKVY